jgi:acetyl-CoA C-acetyltransferase
MHEVAIIGVGLHPFGRFAGKSAIDMGAEAIRTALRDAGADWKDVQFAFGGSFEVDNPDAVVGQLGCTGIPFMDVYNGCATAATALELTADAIRMGKYDLGVAVGMDKHLRAPSLPIRCITAHLHGTAKLDNSLRRNFSP